MKKKQVGLTTLAATLMISGMTLTQVNAKDELKVTMPVINPIPKTVNTLGNGMEISSFVNLIGADVADQDAVEELKRFLKENNIIINETNNENDTTIMLGEAEDNVAEINDMASTLKLPDAKEQKEEGYVLAANDNQIMIEGADESGTYYGVKTLKAMLQKKDGKNVLPEASIIDEPDMEERGIVEGFYGTPWSHEDRLNQLKFYGEQKLNLYIYAPKDDPYHRNQWRDPYPPEEMARMQELINTAKANKVDFVFAISPGIDIRFDGKEGEEDIQALIDKAQSMYDMGVRSFAIYFDDIADRSGDKQANVLNQFNERFIKTHEDVKPLITVPTEYFYSGMMQNGNKSPYTAAFSENLDKDIQVMWTGNEVVSQGVSTEDAKNAYNVFERKMALFWNYPVNDYNTKKLALGPIYGLSSEVEDTISTLAMNPMEFAETSKISIYTGADYSWNLKAYDPETSFKNAVNELYGENAEDFYYFANHTTRVDNGRPDAPEMQALVDTYFTKVLSGKDVSFERTALIGEFEKMEEVSKRLKTNLPKEVLEETSKQLDAFATNAKYAKEAMEMMDAILSNDVVSWWELKQSSLEHQDAMLNANAQVSNVVKNFIAQAHEAGNKLYDNTIPKDRKEVIDYKGSASMEAQQYSEWWYTAKPYEASNFAIDNTDKAYMSKDNVEKDSYVQIDLGKEMDVYSIYLLQGRTETDKTVSGKFSYSIDGQNWIELGKEVSDYETILTNLNIKAQYIRFTASKAEDFQWFVRDFKVNKDISNEIASSSIEGYTGEVVRKIEESSDGTAPVVLAHYNDKIEVKAGDTFTLSLRDFKYIKDVKADFGVKGVVEFTRNDVDWVMATQDQLASHPIATRVRFRATENGMIKNATLKVTNEERNPGTYTSNYTFRDGYGLDRINNFDIASNAVSVTTEAGQYLQLDLGRVTHVRDLKLIFNESYSGDRPTDVTLSYSIDGEEWINLPYNIYSWYNEFTNVNVDARYLKYTVNQTRGGTWTRIGEFSVNTSAPETVWEASVNGKQPTNRVTNMNDYDLSTNYSPVSNIKAGDTIVYHFNKDRDLKRLHVLQSSKNITEAKVIARTVDRKEIVLGTLDKGYTILDMPKQVDVESIKIEFTKDFTVDENNPVEIYEVTPEFYTLDEIKEQAKALIKEAKELLKTPTNKKDVKEVLESAISSLEALVDSSTDRHEITNGINELKAAMEYYKSGNSGEDNGNNNGDNGAIKPDSPDTGESTNTTLFATMLMASAAMLTFLKRKKRED